MNLKRIQHGLLIAVAVAAGLFVVLGTGLAYLAAFEKTFAEGERTLNGLLVAVEKTAAIGAYANDAILLREVVEGLALNPLVESVTVKDAKGAPWVLSHTSPQAVNPAQVILVDRPLYSPFDPKEQLATLQIQANTRVMRAAARSEATLLAVLMLVQGFGVTVLLYLVATRLVSRPIIRIGENLRRITPGTGEQLTIPAFHQNDELGALVTSANDLLRANDQALQRERDLKTELARLGDEYRVIFSASSAGIFVITPDLQLVHCNDRARELSHWDVGLSSGGFIDTTFAQPQLLRDMVERARVHRGTEAADLALRTNEGPTRWVHCMITARLGAPDQAPDATVAIEGVMYDITERKGTEQAISHQAEHDPLTSLRNRRGAETLLTQMLSEARDTGQQVCVIFLDLDGFKQINDSRGHESGDKVLQEVAYRLKTNVRRDSDLCARFGGDEFMVALKNTGENSANLWNTAQGLLECLRAPIVLANGEQVGVGASLGIACYPRHGGSAEQLIRCADQAMYEVKRTGKNTFAVAC